MTQPLRPPSPRSALVSGRYLVAWTVAADGDLDSGERAVEVVALDEAHAVEVAGVGQYDDLVAVERLDAAPEPPPLLVSRAEAARQLGLSVSSFDGLGVPYVQLRPGGRRLYDPADLRALIERAKRT